MKKPEYQERTELCSEEEAEEMFAFLKAQSPTAVFARPTRSYNIKGKTAVSRVENYTAKIILKRVVQ